VRPRTTHHDPRRIKLYNQGRYNPGKAFVTGQLLKAEIYCQAHSGIGGQGRLARLMKATRVIALYLPQFHPVPENDAWWGKGFTEWTNTAKAKPLFRGHYQPHIPADLGFYDLRVPETREAQAAMAHRYGIEGFCYYHYWFAGRRVLERPFNEVLLSGAPDFPFCLCWANQTWSGVWHGARDRILIEQTYPGRADHQAHFQALLPAFADPRYIRVEGKPIFLIYDPHDLPDTVETLALWRAMAVDAGLGGLHIVGQSWSAAWNWTADGFDARVDQPALSRPWISRRQPVRWARNKLGIWWETWRGLPHIQHYQAFSDRQIPAATADDTFYPCLIHAWDNTPRSGRKGVVIKDATPELFRQLLNSTIQVLKDRPPERRLLFLKSWNEWAEGNHLEPDLKFGTRFLQAISEALST
jgi:lipopolysaccharide biosynthesis protein